MKLRITSVLLVVGFSLVATACGSVRVPGSVGVDTRDIVIEGEDFRLVEGEAEPLPFTVAPRPVTDDVIDRYDDFRELGAEPVKVHVPGRAEPLHGLLSLHELPQGAKGPGSRSLSIRIPPEYIQAALGGKVSVVYEPVQSEFTMFKCWPAQAARCGAGPHLGWVLWMSDRPF